MNAGRSDSLAPGEGRERLLEPCFFAGGQARNPVDGFDGVLPGRKLSKLGGNVPAIPLEHAHAAMIVRVTPVVEAA
jgi:hypothetical protein